MLSTRRITQKARDPETKEGHPIGLLKDKEMYLRRLSTDEPVLSE